MEFDCLPDAASNACVPCSTESTPPTLRCFMRRWTLKEYDGARI